MNRRANSPLDLIWQYREQLLAGTWVTIQLALGSLVIAVVFGLLGASMKLSRSRSLNAVANGYTTIVRGIPDLVLILLVFFGGQQLVNQVGRATGLWGYVEISQFAAGMGTIGVIFGGYFTETFRGAILAVPKGQIEAAEAIGMTRAQVFRLVTLPQMIRHALPGFSNTWLVQIKATALVSIIGLQDLVYNAFAAGRSTRQLFTFMFAVLVVYLVLTAISDIALRLLDRRVSRGQPKLADA